MSKGSATGRRRKLSSGKGMLSTRTTSGPSTAATTRCTGCPCPDDRTTTVGRAGRVGRAENTLRTLLERTGPANRRGFLVAPRDPRRTVMKQSTSRLATPAEQEAPTASAPSRAELIDNLATLVVCQHRRRRPPTPAQTFATAQAIRPETPHAPHASVP